MQFHRVPANVQKHRRDRQTDRQTGRERETDREREREMDRKADGQTNTFQSIIRDAAVTKRLDR